MKDGKPSIGNCLRLDRLFIPQKMIVLKVNLNTEQCVL